MLPCPKCQVWVSPEREQLAGWQDAESLIAAREASAFACPKCGELWNDDDRRVANAGSRLVHNGQSFADDGEVKGDAPQTDTLGFHYSAVNNLFVTTAEIGCDEWRARRSADEDNAEREMRQFVVRSSAFGVRVRRGADVLLVKPTARYELREAENDHENRCVWGGRPHRFQCPGSNSADRPATVR